MEASHVERIFDDLRDYISRTDIDIGEEIIRVTVSIGLCMDQMGSLEEMINQSDKMLYDAKNKGRNRVSFLK